MGLLIVAVLLLAIIYALAGAVFTIGIIKILILACAVFVGVIVLLYIVLFVIFIILNLLFG